MYKQRESTYMSTYVHREDICVYTVDIFIYRESTWIHINTGKVHICIYAQEKYAYLYT